MEELIEKSNVGFIKANGFEIVSITKDKVELKYIAKKSGLNPMGIIHGGLLFGLADTAAGTLAFTTGKKCVTTSCNMNYLKPALKKVTATATILKIGKNIGYYYVELKENNTLVATANVNMFFLD